MPSDNDKILEALAQNKKTGTDNQNITEKYIRTQKGEVVEELMNTTVTAQNRGTGAAAAGGAATGAALGTAIAPGIGTAIGAAAGGVAGLAGNIGAPQGNRAALSMQKFLAGRGGGISQMVGSVLGTVGGQHFQDLKADHATGDTAKYLREKLTPLLRRHDNKVTKAQLKSFLKGIPLTEGGDMIDPEKLTALTPYEDNHIFEEDALAQIIDLIASQLQELALTGEQVLLSYDELAKVLAGRFSPADIAIILGTYTLGSGDPADPSGAPLFPF